MKTKTRNIILISIAVVLLIVIVLCSTLFTVKSVRINFLDTNNTLIQEDIEESILNSGAIRLGQSVFLMDRDKTTQKVEKSAPYIRVINIETIFPDVLKVNCVERRECFSIKLNNSSYAILDRHYKILRIANATPLTSINLQVDDALVGDFIQSEYITYYKALIESFEIINKYESAINQLYLSIELVEDSGRLDFVIKSRHGNVVYNIQDIEHKLKEKVNKLVSVPSDGFYNTSINIYVSNNQVIAEKIS